MKGMDERKNRKITLQFRTYSVARNFNISKYLTLKSRKENTLVDCYEMI